jgi:hypothetical protein
MMSKLIGLVVAGILLGASTTSAQVIYGAAYLGPNAPATLYTISPTTGAATAIGPIGFNTVSALDARSGKLYGVGIDGGGTFLLLKINPLTGAGTAVGPTGLSGPFQDIAFRPSDGTLFGYAAGRIYTIDTTTGTATLVGSTGFGFPLGNGLAFSSADILYTANQTNLQTINQTTGAATTVTALTYSPAFGVGESRANGMKFDPQTGTLWASVATGHGPVTFSLGTIDITTGNVTRIGPTVQGLDAIAIVIAGAGAPAASPQGMIALCVLLAVMGIATLRRTLKAPRS